MEVGRNLAIIGAQVDYVHKPCSYNFGKEVYENNTSEVALVSIHHLLIASLKRFEPINEKKLCISKMLDEEVKCSGMQNHLETSND